MFFSWQDGVEGLGSKKNGRLKILELLHCLTPWSVVVEFSLCKASKETEKEE